MADSDSFKFASRRSVVIAKNGCVASSNPLSSQIGLDILKKGGNAADAAVAVAAALNVTEPMSTGLGGDAFCMFYDNATKTVKGLNGSGRCPKALSLEKLKSEGFDQSHRLPQGHGHTVTVPGAASAWVDTVSKYGSGKWHKNAHGRELLLNGKAPGHGDIMRNPYLANTLKDMEWIEWVKEDSIELKNNVDTPRSKVAKWLHESKRRKEEFEPDYSDDDDCDYVPESDGSSSDSKVSDTVPILGCTTQSTCNAISDNSAPSTSQQNRPPKALGSTGCTGDVAGTRNKTDDDCDYVPESDGSSSDSKVSDTVPILGCTTQSTCNAISDNSAPSTSQQNRPPEALGSTGCTGDVAGTRNKTKPKRICKFCNEWQTHLKRHIVRRHPSEVEVIEALKLPEKDQMQAFAKMNSMLDRPYDLWDDSLFVKMRNLILTRVTLFNARRSGEPARLTLREWADASRDAWIDPQLTEQVKDPQERLLLKDMKLAYQAGKGSRKLVPVLFPKDTLEPISKLLMERINCSIHPDNIYLFPNTQNSLDHASGYHCLKAVVKEVPNLKKPHLLIADKFRHQVSTVFASFELPKDQQSSFIRHMGHSEAINRNVYQCPMAIQEITQVGKMLSNIDSNTLNIRNEAAHDMEDTVGDQQSSSVSEAMGTQGNQNTIENGESEALDDQTVGEKSGGKVIPKKHARTYTKWSSEDTSIVKSYFQKYISDTQTSGSLPPKSEIMEFLSTHDILHGSENKHWLVRTKVFNEKKKFRNYFNKL
ncbi:gamma-glutamyltranspeptidase 1 [Elysia marginata]|uniref:Gamma-glutamyltranspeptidase 1 n=1 Tax=Elysia marginata TaxID=1093978 RepID=A0AAV4G8D3_9GAST|nr:gamma-glutamyltranspeptidase 1 [Elysia marginata]